jgi:ACS family tartrate transporter-like MFS transporter
MMITAYLAMQFFWPAVTLSTNLVVTEVIPCRLIPVGTATVNTLAQLGAFVAPVLWGVSKDATGSYHAGLTLVPLAFLAAAGIALHVRHAARRKQYLPAVAAAAA